VPAALIRQVWYGPPNWLVTRFTSEDRRAFGFWNVVCAAIGAFFFGSKVWYVTVLSVIALIPNFSTETPTEEEDNKEGK